jgi:hypothetical protein
MKFRYDGQNYKTRIDANTICEKDYLIQLPDDRYLMVASWLESYPPQPSLIREVDESVITPNDLVAVAEIA